MVVRDFDPENPPPLKSKQKAMLDALENLPDEEIDFSDIPEHDFSECLPRSSPRPSAAAMRHRRSRIRRRPQGNPWHGILRGRPHGRTGGKDGISQNLKSQKLK